MLYQQALYSSITGITTTNITRQVLDMLIRSGVRTGTCHVSIQLPTVLTNPNLTIPVINGFCGLSI